jgi:hypothetical protein
MSCAAASFKHVKGNSLLELVNYPNYDVLNYTLITLLICFKKKKSFLDHITDYFGLVTLTSKPKIPFSMTMIIHI